MAHVDTARHEVDSMGGLWCNLSCWHFWFPEMGGQAGPVTLPETNIAPENKPLEKEIPIGNHHF